MKYITGIHALNLPCKLETSGDWHTSALKWEDITERESEGSFYGDYGIEQGHTIPEHTGEYAVANTIRALLDLLLESNFAVAQGMRNDFICNEKYTDEVFDLVYKMKDKDNWHEISIFMGKEYRMTWLRFLWSKGDNLLV